MTKVVITAAGKGTRLLPFTKEMPKEMMPIFSQTFTKNKVVLPLLQYIYEQLYSMNFRDYCFVVGREKRSIEDHFTPHETYLRELTGDYKKFITNYHSREVSHLLRYHFDSILITSKTANSDKKLSTGSKLFCFFEILFRGIYLELSTWFLKTECR